MSRRDTHFDAMLRNLGAAYYQSTQGKARAGDVTRALESVAAEDSRRHANGNAGPAAGPPARGHQHGRWRVGDVMTTQVVTVSKTARYKDVVRLMTEHKVNALPVIIGKGQVIGMVSEADVLRKQEQNFRRFGTGLPRRTRRERDQARARTAGELMTAPAITIHAEAPLGAAARLMNGHNIRRLPVVDATGTLIGIVSRRDLLSVFLRSDEEIAAEVRDVIGTILLEDGDTSSVTVRHGVVTLSGTLARRDLIPVAVRLASDVDGVVSVLDRLGSPASPPVTGQPAAALPGSGT
jgi:CBS-domain-containing membrane protein